MQIDRVPNVMKRVQIILDKRRQLQDGTYPVKFYCYIRGKGNFRISSNIHVKENCLLNHTIINVRNAEIYNALLTQKRFKIGDLLLRMQLDGSLFTLSLKEIKQIVKQEISDYKNIREKPKFYNTAKNFIFTRDKEKTKEACEYMLKYIQKYYDKDKLTFEDMDIKFLKDLELKLKQDKLSINTISIIFRNIRAVFNFAISEKTISQDCYPFREYKIKTEKTRKRALSLEQVRALIKLRPETPEKTKTRDIFLLMLYLIGINSKDLLNLTEIYNGRIEYKRAKTGRLYSVKIEPEAMEIINKYRGVEFLLNIAHRDNFTNRFDKVLKKLGKIDYGAYNKQKITPIEPMLSSYYARHTWATFASELDIPKEIIAQALGHGGNTVTDIYIDFNQKKVDIANRKVIDYILGK